MYLVLIDELKKEILFIPLLKSLSFLKNSFIILTLRSGTFITIFFWEFTIFWKFNLKGMLKISPFKSKRLNKKFSSKNKNALEILIIEIISFKLSLKKILLSLILIFFLENLFSLSL